MNAAVTCMGVGFLAILSAQAVTIGPKWSIVIPEKEESGVSAALEELGKNIRYVVKESVGYDLKVVSASAFKGGRAIYLGAAAAEGARLMPDDLKGYENVIAEKNGDIYLFGHDVSGRPNKKNVGWGGCLLPTVKAATRFMEKAMDVRFLAPGEVGMDIPRRKTIELADGTFDRHHPSQAYGAGRNDAMLYCYAANHFGVGKVHTYGGHTYPTACPPSKYFKDHPEYFGLIGGKRVAIEKDNCTTLCISNPKVEDLIVEELLKRFDEGSDVCQLGQQDGSRFCECEKCRNYGGVTDTGEQIWLFHCRIAERIKKLRPGKIVCIMSYSVTQRPPKTFRKFPSNVMIELCYAYDSTFQAWKGYEVPHGFSVYTYLWGGYLYLGAMAHNSYNYLASYARMLRQHNVSNIYRCGYGEFYGTEGPGYYVFNNLLETPKADVGALVDEYCDRAYGPAGRTMRQFHDVIDYRLRGAEMIVNAWVRPKSQLDLHAYVFAPDAVSKLDELLARAETTKGLSDKQRIRLHLVRLEYDYARTMGRIANFYATYRFAPSRATLDLLLDEMEKRNGLIASYTQGKDHVVRLKEWPEIRFFGEFKTVSLKRNGGYHGVVRTPLDWDVSVLRKTGLLPGATENVAKVAFVESEPGFADFETGVWAKAGWQELAGSQLERVPVKARFKVLAGKDALYVAAETDLADNVAVKGCEPGGATWLQENFDMMLAPSGSRVPYYRLVWNPVEGSKFDEAFGLITDTFDPNCNKPDPRWNGRWDFKTSRTNGIWRTLVKLPYETFGAKKPMSGNRWRFNLGRASKFAAGQSTGAYNLLWNPNLAKTQCLNDPDAMGTLEFE